MDNDGVLYTVQCMYTVQYEYVRMDNDGLQCDYSEGRVILWMYINQGDFS